MLFKLTSLKGRTVAATDGDIGSVDDIYFDDQRWGVRYFVVDTGGWLGGRKVLISPLALRPGIWPDGGIPVNLTREQVEKSPPMDSDRPVSRHYEMAHAAHYRNSYYWTGPHLWGIGGYSTMLGTEQVPPTSQDEEMRAMADAERAAAETTHLRSAREVIGYKVAASDGTAGEIDDFLVETDTWQIVRLVVDSRNWLPGGQVLVSPEAVDHIDWNISSLRLNMTQDEVRASPEFHP